MAQVSTPTAETELEWSSRFIAVATWSVATFSLLLPAERVYAIAVTSYAYLGSGRAIYAVVALAGYLPVQTWLVLSAMRRPFGRAQLVGLIALAAVLFGMIPVAGAGWLGTLYVLGALVLVGFRPPWSIVLFCVLVISITPLALALGRPDAIGYFTAGSLAFDVSLAVAIRLIRAARDLQEARLALAHQAVVGEQLRIDDEVGAALRNRLDAIADEGVRAEDMAATNYSGAARHLAALIEDARRTLAEARRVIARYREVSVAGELHTVSTLLSAAGIAVRLELPSSLPTRIDERDRESLRRAVAHVLEGSAQGTAVIISVMPQGERLHVNLRTRPIRDADGLAPT